MHPFPNSPKGCDLHEQISFMKLVHKYIWRSLRFLKNRREAQNISWNSFIKLIWYVVLVHFIREQNYWYQTSSDCFVFRKCLGRGWRESEFTSLTRSSIFIYLWGNKNERRGAVQNNQTPMLCISIAYFLSTKVQKLHNIQKCGVFPQNTISISFQNLKWKRSKVQKSKKYTKSICSVF